MRKPHDRIRRLAPLAALCIAAPLAACGGSDGDGGDGGDTTEASADEAGEESTEPQESAEPTESGESTDDPPTDAGTDDEDSSGEGTNDEAQESFDDAGVDLDLDQLEEDIAGFSTGEGGGTVTIDGAAYTFEATGVCISQGNDFAAEGLGEGPDGEAAWVSVNASEFDFDDDGTPDPSVDVYVEVGKTELFGSGPDDAPDWTASWVAGLGMPEISYELDGGSISGSGEIQDVNGVAIGFGESVPFTFEASCS